MILYDNWTRAEIDLDALEHNYRTLCARLKPGCRAMAMVKADAYGHGAIEVARCLEGCGVSYFGVANIFEALSLREAGIRTPILILGHTPAELTEKLIEYDITQNVTGADVAGAYGAAATALGRTLRVHIKLDTGMSRYGIVCRGRTEEAANEALAVCETPGLSVEGVLTHFACSDEEDGTATEAQLADFTAVLDLIGRKYKKDLLKHCANSAAVLQYRHTQFDMVRLGIALYGLEPAPGLSGGTLRPVMTMKCPVTLVKTVPAGTSVSYGMRFTTQRETRIATVPLGYGDGYLRAYAGACMTVRGKSAPVIGRICMDICMLDVTDIPDVREGDEVTVFGAPPHTTAEDLAKIAGTISYEVVTGISKRVLRLFLRDGKPVARLSYI